MAVNVNESSSIKTLSKVLQNESNRVKTDDSVYTNNSGTLIKLFPYDRTLDAWNWYYWPNHKEVLNNCKRSSYDNNHGCIITVDYNFPYVGAYTTVRRGEKFRVSVLSEAKGYYGNPVGTEGIDTDFPMVWVGRTTNTYTMLSDEQKIFNSTYNRNSDCNVLQANTSSPESALLDYWPDSYYVTNNSFVTFTIPEDAAYATYKVYIARNRLHERTKSTFTFYIEFLNQ
jgi:hypothetical protein